MRDTRQPLTPHCYRHPDLLALDWCDQLLVQHGADLDLRGARARQLEQDTVSLALTAQRALIERLRDDVRAHFWDETHRNVRH
jgi:hypothetical protein